MRALLGDRKPFTFRSTGFPGRVTHPPLIAFLVTVLVLALTAPALGQASGWALVPSPNRGPDALLSVSCVSATACTAAGYRQNRREFGKTLIESWNGTRWSVVPSPNASPAPTSDVLSGVSCVSATACTAVGGYTNGGQVKVFKTLIESWNGTSWSVVPSPNPDPAENGLSGVSCVSATACTAVGTYGAFSTLIESWNGTSWSVVPSPNPSSSNHLFGVSCVSATACTAVGDYNNPNDRNLIQTLIESWNGTSWSVVPSPNASPANDEDFLSGVSCVSATACTAVGDYEKAGSGVYKTLIESRNGTSWSVVPSPDPGPASRSHFASLTGVSCVSATACTAAGYYRNSRGKYKTLIESRNGTSWSVAPTPNPSPADGPDFLTGVSCAAATACTAAGYRINSRSVDRTLIESN